MTVITASLTTSWRLLEYALFLSESAPKVILLSLLDFISHLSMTRIEWGRDKEEWPAAQYKYPPASL